MPRQRHEIPTHLNVEDKAFYGFSARQVMYLIVGLSGGYSFWTQWPALAVPIRVTLIALWLVGALILALVRPHGRGLDEWAFVGLHYLAAPKASVWRPCVEESENGGAPDRAWEELSPRLAWQEGQE